MFLQTGSIHCFSLAVINGVLFIQCAERWTVVKESPEATGEFNTTWRHSLLGMHRITHRIQLALSMYKRMKKDKNKFRPLIRCSQTSESLISSRDTALRRYAANLNKNSELWNCINWLQLMQNSEGFVSWKSSHNEPRELYRIPRMSLPSPPTASPSHNFHA
jgi:hypothetical protein